MFVTCLWKDETNYNIFGRPISDKAHLHSTVADVANDDKENATQKHKAKKEKDVRYALYFLYK